MKICIPSKDRAETIITHTFFDPKDVLIFVEPQEIKKYQFFHPDYIFVNIKKSDQGLEYVRNFILDYVTDDKLIMIDDDIKYFGIRNKTGHYNKLRDLSKMLNDIDKGLDTHWGYGIPSETFAYFSNKNSNNQRLYFDKTLFNLHGLNRKELCKRKIYYDQNIKECEDTDISVQIALHGNNVCIDYQYIFASQPRMPGGLTFQRKFNSSTFDDCIRIAYENLANKYGNEFVKITHDSAGYIIKSSFDMKLLFKRKEVAKKNLEKYQKNE